MSAKINVQWHLDCPRCGATLNYEGPWPPKDRFPLRLWNVFWREHGRCRKPKLAAAGEGR